MSLYESVFIARQDISTAQVDGLTETFEKIITDNGGAVKKTEQWGLRTLAYKIKKNRKGYYVLFNIDGPSDAVQEMERQMHINEDILRFLTTRVDELEEGPSAVLRAKDRDDDRDRGRGRPREFDKKPGFDKKPDAPAEKPSDDKAAKPADDKAAKPADDKAAKPKAKTDDEAAAVEEKGQEEKSDAAPDKADKPADKEGAATDKADAATDKADAAPDKADKPADKEGDDK